MTAALSTRLTNSRAATCDRVTIASVCPLLQRRMWSVAACRLSTTPTARSSERYSAAQSASVTGSTSGENACTTASPWTVTLWAASAASRIGRTAAAAPACTRTVSVALQTLRRVVLPSSTMATTMATSQSASTYTVQLPTPVSMTGTTLPRTTEAMRSAPPRGMRTSTSPRVCMSSVTLERSVPGTSWTQPGRGSGRAGRRPPPAYLRRGPPARLGCWPEGRRRWPPRERRPSRRAPRPWWSGAAGPARPQRPGPAGRQQGPRSCAHGDAPERTAGRARALSALVRWAPAASTGRSTHRHDSSLQTSDPVMPTTLPTHRPHGWVHVAHA